VRFNALLEMALAARWWGIGWDAFRDLEIDDQAFHIAVYRVQAMTEAVESWHAHKEASRK